MVERIKNGFRRLQTFADRPWYFLVVGLLAALDLFVLVIPTDAILISTVLLQRRRWASAAFCVGLGGAVAAFALAGAIQWDGPEVMQVWFPEVFHSPIWQTVNSFFDDHGATALFLWSASPFMQLPAVAVAALSGMSAWNVFLVCFVGRTLKAGVIAYFASHAPALLLKIPLLQKELSALGFFEEEALPEKKASH